VKKMHLNIFNEDFKDFLLALNTEKVKYILVGGYAVILHGYNRTTGDLDIWVERTKENFNRLVAAFKHFGLPTNAISLISFLNLALILFQKITLIEHKLLS